MLAEKIPGDGFIRMAKARSLIVPFAFFLMLPVAYFVNVMFAVFMPVLIPFYMAMAKKYFDRKQKKKGITPPTPAPPEPAPTTT